MPLVIRSVRLIDGVAEVAREAVDVTVDGPIDRRDRRVHRRTATRWRDRHRRRGPDAAAGPHRLPRALPHRHDRRRRLRPVPPRTGGRDRAPLGRRGPPGPRGGVTHRSQRRLTRIVRLRPARRDRGGPRAGPWLLAAGPALHDHRRTWVAVRPRGRQRPRVHPRGPRERPRRRRRDQGGGQRSRDAPGWDQGAGAPR